MLYASVAQVSSARLGVHGLDPPLRFLRPTQLLTYCSTVVQAAVSAEDLLQATEDLLRKLSSDTHAPMPSDGYLSDDDHFSAGRGRPAPCPHTLQLQHWEGPSLRPHVCSSRQVVSYPLC